MKNIEHGLRNIFFWVGDKKGAEKITMGIGETGVHYTLIFKGDKKIVDLHKAFELPGGRKTYEPIFEMPVASFEHFMSLLIEAIYSNIHKFWFNRRINIGRLKHYRMILLPMMPDESKAYYFIDNKKKKKIRFKKDIPRALILEMFLYPEQIQQRGQESFFAYAYKRGRLRFQGIVLQIVNGKETPSLYFINNDQYRKFVEACRKEMNGILKQLSYCLI